MIRYPSAPVALAGGMFRTPAAAQPEAVASGPIAMTGTVSAGHWDAMDNRTVVRFSISSTSTRTAVRSVIVIVDGVTIVARARSRVPLCAPAVGGIRAATTARNRPL